MVEQRVRLVVVVVALLEGCGQMPEVGLVLCWVPRTPLQLVVLVEMQLLELVEQAQLRTAEVVA